ncbi:MAG: hypothetical protein KGZ38_09770 [Erysipelothrix sp.]|nr:hypothetical protein [Erysipelothrix sp.]MBS3988239.1 hypothetical protein [Erysipelothrix sp.]
MKRMKNQYEGIVLITKHHKEVAIKPLIETQLQCTLHVIDDVDTDRFGTFSREIKRKKSQFDTARLKIKHAYKSTNATRIIASEGSFGSHPMIPIPWNVELVVLKDYYHNVEVIGVYESSDTNFAHHCVSSYEDALSFATSCQFPTHGLIMRPDHEHHKFIIKDIVDETSLHEAFEVCLAKSITQHVFIETDMRAHRNPTRMHNIAKATQHMIEQYLSTCPRCNCPGFTITNYVLGLPCELCAQPTQMVLKHVYQCQRCKYTEEKWYPKGQTCPANYCNTCNP